MIAMAAVTIIRRARSRHCGGSARWQNDGCKRTMRVIVPCEESFAMSQTLRSNVRPITRTATEHTFRTSDGVELFYRAWPPASESQRAVVLFHRGHEHSARWQDFIDRIGTRRHLVLRLGRPRPRPVARRTRLCRKLRPHGADADEFVRHLSTQFDVPIENMAVVAQSVGAVLAAAWVHDYAPPIRALVIATPALRVKLYVPLAIPSLRVLRMFKPKSFIHSYVKPKMLTHDFEQARVYASDELISPQIAVNILLDLYDTSTRLIRDAGAIQTPTLLLDVRQRLGRAKAAAASAVRQALVAGEGESELSGLLPLDVLGKGPPATDRPHAAIRARVGVRRAAAGAVAAGCRRNRLHAAQVMTAAMPAARRLVAMAGVSTCSECMLNTVGRLSKGVQLAGRTGFDSGQSLDHVYRNTPEGCHVPGPLIDKQLSRLARLARHPPAQNPHAAAARRRDRDAPQRESADADSRHRRRPRPLRARYDRPASRAGRRNFGDALRPRLRRPLGRPQAGRVDGHHDRRLSRRATRSTAEAIAAIEPRPNDRDRLWPVRTVSRERAGPRVARAAWRRPSNPAACCSTPISRGTRSRK